MMAPHSSSLLGGGGPSPQAMVEGVRTGGRAFLSKLSQSSVGTPSTMLRMVPLPRGGRNWE
jgi:hypothetical protein